MEEIQPKYRPFTDFIAYALADRNYHFPDAHSVAKIVDMEYDIAKTVLILAAPDISLENQEIVLQIAIRHSIFDFRIKGSEYYKDKLILLDYYDQFQCLTVYAIFEKLTDWNHGNMYDAIMRIDETKVDFRYLREKEVASFLPTIHLPRLLFLNRWKVYTKRFLWKFVKKYGKFGMRHDEELAPETGVTVPEWKKQEFSLLLFILAE